jgi:signal transduction histidine kinase
MKWSNSFRYRMVVGTFLWTLGLIPILHLLFLVIHHQMRAVSALGVRILLVFSFLCISGGIWQFRAAILPFGRLRRQLSGLRDGSNLRVEGTYPNEVQPLVNDLNSLLEHREHLVRRALAKAGDLAHGLKTPLAVLAQEAERVSAEGEDETASRIHMQVDRMRRQIDYHLTQSRATSPNRLLGARCSVLVCVEALARTLLKLYAARRLEIEVDVSAAHGIRGQREDLEEMLGNLLDNACKWAKSKVKITSIAEDYSVLLTVDDDGPGIPASIRDQMLQRGMRADESAPGFGLGLAIVQDLVELYEGTITLDASELGGLRALLRLPH